MAPKFSPLALVADSLGELAEYLIDKLGPVGLTLIGIGPLVAALKKLGAGKPYAIHTIDVAAKVIIRRFITDQTYLNMVFEALDAYFDRVKIIASSTDEAKTNATIGEGMEAAKAKLKSAIEKKSKAEGQFDVLFAQLSTTNSAAFMTWYAAQTDERKARFQKEREQIKKFEVLNKFVNHIVAGQDPFVLLDALYGHKPTFVETLGEAVSGGKTPQVEAIRTQVKATEVDLKAKEKRQAAIAAAYGKLYK